VKRLLLVLVLATIAAAAPPPLDSQAVLMRYETALAAELPPKAMIFTYSVSQAGPMDIEQRHRVYRSGDAVRDETIAINGNRVHHKMVRISHRPNPYAIAVLAPRPDAYAMLFLQSRRQGSHYDYVYETDPLAHGPGFVVDRVTVDGIRFLPRVIDFHTTGDFGSGTGQLVFGSVDGHWVVLSVSVNAVVNGTIARERIDFSEYSFPPALPRSTFL
jgi:hypothetical protein